MFRLITLHALGLVFLFNTREPALLWMALASMLGGGLFWFWRAHQPNEIVYLCLSRAEPVAASAAVVGWIESVPPQHEPIPYSVYLLVRFLQGVSVGELARGGRITEDQVEMRLRAAMRRLLTMRAIELG